MVDFETVMPRQGRQTVRSVSEPATKDDELFYVLSREAPIASSMSLVRATTEERTPGHRLSMSQGRSSAAGNDCESGHNVSGHVRKVEQDGPSLECSAILFLPYRAREGLITDSKLPEYTS